MRSTVRFTTMFVFGSFLLACGPVNRTIVFDGYPQPDRDSATPFPSRVVLEKPQLTVDSTCSGGCTWSDDERKEGEVHFGADVARLLGSQNVTDVDPRARYIASVKVRMEERHSRNGLAALRFGIPLTMAIGSAVAGYELAPSDPGGGNSTKISAAVTGVPLSYALWSLVFMTLPSRTVHYRSEATVTIRDRASNQPVAQETTSADFEDTFSDYGLPEKWDRASGTALRLLEPKVASLISTRMRALPQSSAVSPLPPISIPHLPSPAASSPSLVPAPSPARVPAPALAPTEPLPRTPPAPASPEAAPAGGV